MKIRDAIDQATKGKMVQRDFWDVGTYLMLSTENPGFVSVAVADNPLVVWEPSVHDLLAKDWIVIHEVVIDINN